MAGFTNKGKYKILGWTFRAATKPSNLYVALITVAVAPGPDTNTFSELTEITAGNGYTSGGYQLAFNATDFDVWTEDDGNDKAYLQIKDLIWTASGGPIPLSGNGARYAILTDDNGTVGSREVYGYWDLTSDRSVVSGQALKLVNLQLDFNES